MRIEKLGENVLVAVDIIPEFDVEDVIKDLALENFEVNKGLCLSMRFDNKADFIFGTLVNDNTTEEDDNREMAHISLKLEDIEKSLVLKNLYAFAILSIKRLEDNGENLPVKMPEAVKELVDMFWEGSLDLKGNPRGAGRQIVVYKDYVLKFPVETGDAACGVRQNEYEEHITNVLEEDKDLEDAIPVINKVVHTYRGINVYKKLNTDLEFMMNKAGVKNVDELQNHINVEYGWRLSCLFDYEDLDEEDALRYKNWGYDEEEETFKCLDYGINLSEG